MEFKVGDYIKTKVSLTNETRVYTIRDETRKHFILGGTYKRIKKTKIQDKFEKITEQDYIKYRTVEKMEQNIKLLKDFTVSLREAKEALDSYLKVNKTSKLKNLFKVKRKNHKIQEELDQAVFDLTYRADLIKVLDNHLNDLKETLNKN